MDIEQRHSNFETLAIQLLIEGNSSPAHEKRLFMCQDSMRISNLGQGKRFTWQEWPRK